MRVGETGQLRQMGHAEHLMLQSARPCTSRQTPQLLSHHRADSSADALVDLVEDERGSLVGAGKHGLERQHQARCLAAGGDLRHRLQRFARIGRD